MICIHTVRAHNSPIWQWWIVILMEQLRAENKKLRELRGSCEEELEKLKDVGRSHEHEIDTLLKFNERLLGIIENEFNAAAKNKISSDLQIISEANEGDFAANNKLRAKMPAPPRIAAHFQPNSLQGFEDDDEEEEIYNQDPPQPPQPPPQPPRQPDPPVVAPPRLLEVPKMSKLERVFELQQKDEEVSINLSNSIKNSNPTSSVHNQGYGRRQEAAPELAQLKEMIKEYREEFADNSAEYEQICEIIHNDLLGDLQEFRRIEEQSREFYKAKTQQVNALRAEIKRFRPAQELQRVMKKLSVPPQTQKLLHQKIISKQS